MRECVLKKIVAKLAVCGLLIVLGGCAGGVLDPDAQTQQPADSKAALGTEKIDWKTPFWQRWLDEARGQDNVRSADSGAPRDNRQPQIPARRIEGLQPKVGVYIEGGERDSLGASELINALERHAPAQGLAVITPDALDDAVGQTSACSSNDPLDCPEVLAIFPGVRVLLVVTIQSSGNNGIVRVTTRMRDTDFGAQYQPTTTRLQLARAGSRTESPNLSIWSNRVLGAARDRIGVAPWFAHSFALDGDDLYINAGRFSGLEVGSTLVLHDDGAVIRAPGGQIIAWRPGPPVGRLQVKQLIGQYIAIAQLVSGQMPKPQDKLTAADSAQSTSR